MFGCAVKLENLLVDTDQIDTYIQCLFGDLS